MRKIFSIVLSFLIFQHLQAQLTKLPPVMSADVASLGKYGTYEVNYNTGSPGISVPLYNLKSSFIPVNIGLNYDSKGFMPNESGYDVGKNWNLTAGGAITRIVNGEPDDKYNPNVALGGGNPEAMLCEKKGFIYGITSTGSVFSTSYINNLSNYTNLTSWNTNPVTECTYPVYSLPYEYQPDMFSFNFLGYSGKFFMGNDGTIKVISDNKFKVDVSGLGNRYDYQIMINNILVQGTGVNEINTVPVSIIKLTADDGTEFTFGGALKDIEISFSGNQSQNIPVRGAVPNSGVITAWYLTKVKSKEGKEIIFQNENFIEEDTGPRKDRTIITTLFETAASGVNESSVNYSPFYELRFSSNRNQFTKNCGTGSSSSETHPIVYSRSIVKKCYLSKIISDLEEINFNYTKNQRFYTSDNPDFDGNLVAMVNLNKPMVTQRLTSIVAKDRKLIGVSIPNSGFEELNNAVRFITLNYNYYRNYLFLEDVISGNQKTEFKYNSIDNPQNLPQPMTYGIDYLGYYNGKNTNFSFIGTMNMSTYNMEYPNSDREPDPAFSTIGIIKEIIHPTKGKTILEFENHKIGFQIENNTQNPITPLVTNFGSTGKLVPGLRIKTIQNIPGETVEYKYLSNWETQSGMIPTGILKFSNTSGYYFQQNGYPLYNTITRQENNLIHSANYYESPVSYSEVVKKYNEGFEKFKFSTHLTNPDRVNPVSTSVFTTPELSTSSFNGQMQKTYFRKSSVEIERGMLTASFIYDNSSSLKSSKEYLYNTDASRFNYFGASLIKPGLEGVCIYGGVAGLGVLNVYENFYYHNKISKEISTEYGSTGNLVSTTEYEYISSSNPLLRKQRTTNSKGEVVEHEYKYAEDNPASQSGTVLASMVQKNMTGVVLEDIVRKNSVVLSKNIFTYTLVNNIPALTKEETSNEIKAPGQLLNVLNVTKYTTFGKIAEAELPGNVISTYKWDYEGNFLVAKVQNATEANVRYTSFENANPNPNLLIDWQYSSNGIQHDYNSATGRSYYNLAGGNSVSASNLNASKEYIISYWIRNDAGITTYIPGGTITHITTSNGPNGWIYVQKKFSGTNSFELTGNAQIDELRLYPKEAMMETFTYETMLGVTSKCDQADKISYYKYDGYGRLVLIRDQDRNIIKKICYNYSGEVENCDLCTVLEPYWQNTNTPPTCEQGPCGNTGYQIQEQINVNPCSSATTRNYRFYNPSACTPASGTIVTYVNNTGLSGYTATYSTKGGGPSYSFPIPATGSGALGCIPEGVYSLTISKTPSGIAPMVLFGSGCHFISGSWSVSFSSIYSCYNISLDWDF